MDYVAYEADRKKLAARIAAVKEIIRETRHDKKMEHGTIKFILLRAVGEADIFKDVSEAEMRDVFGGRS